MKERSPSPEDVIMKERSPSPGDELDCAPESLQVKLDLLQLAAPESLTSPETALESLQLVERSHLLPSEETMSTLQVLTENHPTLPRFQASSVNVAGILSFLEENEPEGGLSEAIGLV
ncbi:hypothetical protein FCV25MIE_23047 [Fagus crenata]